MKSSKSWLRYFFIFAFLIFATPVLADKLPTPSFTPPATDVSMSFLGQLFGTVGNVTHAQDGQILGKMMEILNEGLLAFIAMFLGYTIITVVLRAANEGSFQSSNKQVAFLILRIAIGVGLVLPNPTTGYTLMQDIVMKVVSAGVALADDTWDAALNYLNDGGILYNTSKNDGSNDIKNLASAMIGMGVPGAQMEATHYQFEKSASSAADAPNNLVMQHIFADEVCMLNSAYQESHKNNPNSGSDSGNGVYNNQHFYQYHPEIDKNAMKIYFPGYGDQQDPDHGHYGARCGVVSAAAPGSEVTLDTFNKNSKSFPVITKLVEDELPLAKAYEHQVVESQSSAPSDLSATAGKTVGNSVLGFYNLLQLYQSQKKVCTSLNGSSCEEWKQKTPQDNYKFMTDAKKYGWMMAGRYYWDLERFTDHAQAVGDVTNSLPYVSSYQTTLPDSVRNVAANALSDFNTYYQPSAINNFINPYLQTMGDTNIAQGGGHSTPTIGNKIVQVFLDCFKSIYNAFGRPVANPIQYLMNVGQSCLHVIHEAFKAAFYLALGLATGMGICTSEAPGGQMWSAVSNWAQSLCVLLIAAVAVPGIILSFYVPLYPYVLFTFSTIGWMIIVLEAMLAAPLICYGLTHPENHDFLGQAQQAIMLLLSVFLRPVLLIIGLVAGIILSYVSLRLLIFGFHGIMTDLFQAGTNGIVSQIGHAAGTAGLGSAIGFLGLLMMFGGLVYTLIQQAFSAVYVVPNGIMKWVGTQGTQDQSPEQMARQIQSFGSAPGSQAGKMTEVGSGAGKAMGGIGTVATGTGISGARAPEGSKKKAMASFLTGGKT